MPKKTTLILTVLASLTMTDSLLAQDFLGEWRRKNTMMTDSFQFYKNGTWRESLAVVGGPDLEFPQDYIEPGHEESKATWVVILLYRSRALITDLSFVMEWKKLWEGLKWVYFKWPHLIARWGLVAGYAGTGPARA